MVVDTKFKFVATNPCKGNVYTEENAMIFVAKDKALLNTLRFYQEECKKIGSGDSHIESVGLWIERVEKFQEENESRIPDTELDCEIDRCIGGILNT